MPWTHQQIQAADAALSPPVADPAEAAAALNAQTATLSSQSFLWGAAKHIARVSGTGDWPRIVARARQAPTLPPATGLDFAILAAINAVESQDDDVISPTDATWTAFQNGLTALQASGDLSAASVSAISALTSVTGPVWVPALQARDVWIARGQPQL